MPKCLAVLMSRWRPVYGEIEFECGHWAVFENAIDMAHIHYLHADSFGNKVTYDANWRSMYTDVS